MSTTATQFSAEQWLAAHFAMSADKKYDSPGQRKRILARMKEFGIAPSTTAAMRAIKELVEEGAVERVDGGSEQSDRAAAKAREEARLKQIASAPLTNQDYDRFSQMSPTEVAEKFYSDREFEARYRAAASRWGFRIPEPPAPADTDITEADDPSEWKNLTADAYYHMPAARIITLYRSDQGFRRSVDRLIAKGLI